ncbi:undecaprenyl-diphosphatase UppP [Candidatus Kaiserbacteria bacterium]|nr:undecaprenyl-diphosphatase UppP [Candidatus Kaiserbacteria bacterium]MCP5303580.1 undecaprenyl-diphosphatase UppP [Pseudomonadales bacterium]
MTILEAIFLGALQGITEFLPISSTGHLILARSIFGLTSEYALAFDAVLHLATVSAVVVYFWADIKGLINATLRFLGRLPVSERDLTLVKALLIGTIPAVIFGLLLESLMDTLFRNPLLVAGVLVAGSLLFMYAEWVYMNSHRDSEMNVTKGFKVGLFQTLALIPGMSRSGACIAGGMILGLSREDAARFAFLLAIPVLTGAGAKKLLELIVSDGSVAWLSVGFGAAAAFLVGLAAIHFMLSFVRRHTLWPFIWYRIILACLVSFIVLFS